MKTPDTLQSVDNEKLDELRGILDDADVNDLISDFFEFCETDISSLRDASYKNLVDDIFRVSHGLKSSSGSLGFIKIAELCRILESQARSNELQDAVSQAENIEAEFNNLKSMFT